MSNVIAIHIFTKDSKKTATITRGEQAVKASLYTAEDVSGNLGKKIKCEKELLGKYEKDGYKVVSINETKTIHTFGEIVQFLYFLIR